MPKNYIKKRLNAEEKKARFAAMEYYDTLRSLLGYDWALFFLLVGGREAGKSYSITEFFVAQYKLRGRPFYWMRLTDKSQEKLLQNNAEKLIDPDIRRRWNLDIVRSGDSVYEVTKRSAPDKKTGKTKILEKKFMCRVMALSTFYNDKGSGLFDNEFLNDPNMYYNIAFDEMNREKDEKRSFDIVYAFVNQIENLIRSTKKRVRIICIGNTLEEASDMLCAFDFIPEKFGRFKIHKKRAVIENIEPSEAYLNRRKGTVADILMPTASTFTNKITTDNALVYKGRLTKPLYIIKFSKNPKENYTVWENNVVTRWNGETFKKVKTASGEKEERQVIAMMPYLDALYTPELKKNIFLQFDTRGFKFRDLITFKQFQKDLELLRPRA